MNGPRLKKSKDLSEERQLDPNQKKRSYQRRGSLLQPLTTKQQLQFNQEPPRVLQQLNTEV